MTSLYALCLTPKFSNIQREVNYIPGYHFPTSVKLTEKFQFKTGTDPSCHCFCKTFDISLWFGWNWLEAQIFHKNDNFIPQKAIFFGFVSLSFFTMVNIFALLRRNQNPRNRQFRSQVDSAGTPIWLFLQ